MLTRIAGRAAGVGRGTHILSEAGGVVVGWVAAVTWSASYQLLLHQSSMTAMTGAEKLSPKIGDFRPNLDECVIAGVRG